jgi:lipoprotein signal peptidase
LFRFLAGIFLTLWWTAIVLNSRKIESLKSWLFVFWAGAIGNLVDSIDNTVQNPILIANDQAGWLAGTNVADILITTSIFAIIYIIGKDSLKQRKERNLKKGVVNEARY